MEILQTIDAIFRGWDQWLGYALAALASVDKLAMVAIKTVSNIRDQYHQSFPQKEEESTTTRQRYRQL